MVCVSDSVMVHDEVKTLGDLQVYHLLHFLQQVQPVAARGSLAPGGQIIIWCPPPPPTSCIRQSPLPFASGAVLHSDSVTLSGRSRGGGRQRGYPPPAKYGLYNYAAFN